MPRFDLGGPVAAPQAPQRRRTARARAGAGKKIFWTLAAAFTGYGVWRFMESRREKEPVECVTVEEEEVEEYEDE